MTDKGQNVFHELEKNANKQIEEWKQYLTQSVSTLVNNFDSEKDCMLILECNDNSSGCVAITYT